MYCQKCGAEIGEDSLFCHKCGSRVRSEDQLPVSDGSEKPLPTTPPVQVRFKVLLIGDIEQRFIPYARNYGRTVSLFVSLIDQNTHETTSEGHLTIVVTDSYRPLRLRGKPEDLLKVQSPAKPRLFLDQGVAEREPFGRLARKCGVAINSMFWGHANVPVSSGSYEYRDLTDVTTGFTRKVLGFSYTSPQKVFVPENVSPSIHVWFLTQDTRLVYGWRYRFRWVDTSGFWY